MIPLNLSFFIVGVFLLLTLVIGVYFSRKKTTFQEYAVGNKQFATATLVATVLATLFSGGALIRNIEQIYKEGIYWIIMLMACSMSIWIFSRLVLRMGPFMHHLSMAESIGSIYGRIPRVITALFAVCISVLKISAQIIVISQAISICMDKVDPQIITVFSTLILVCYSAFGGVRAVTFTDIFQLATFTIVLPVLTWFIFQAIDKPISDIISFLQNQPKFQLSSLFQFDKKLLTMCSFYLAMLIPDLSLPHVMQRVYMSSDPIQVRKVFSYVSLFSCILFVFFILTSLFVFIGSPGLSVESIWVYIIHHIPFTFKGFLTISLLAMSMSTADSCLNACSVIINHDILGTLRKVSLHQMWLIRLITFSLGIFSMVVAFFYNDLLAILMARFDLSIPIITAPFLLALYGFRGTTRTALIGMTTGVLTILAWKKWVEPIYGINGAFIAMLVNGLAMMLAHYLLKQPAGSGWVGPGNEFIQMQQECARKRSEQKEAIKNGLIHIEDALANLQPSHAKIRYVGFYVIISKLLTYFMASANDHRYWIIAQLLVGICFLGYGTFLSEKRQSIPGWVVGLFWTICIAFCLPINFLWHWWHSVDPIFTTSLSLAHCAIILWALPLYLGIGVAATTSLLSILSYCYWIAFSTIIFPISAIYNASIGTFRYYLL